MVIGFWSNFCEKFASKKCHSGGDWLHGEHAQLQTLEGFAAALLMVGTVYLVVTAVTLSVPQTELHVDAQLKTYGRDALAILDASLPPEKDGDYYTSLLKNSVVDWVNGVAGATSFKTEEFRMIENSSTRYTSRRFEFAGPELDTNKTFHVYIPNNTRISHAYVTLTGMPLLNISDGSTTDPETKYELDDPGDPSSDRFGCSIAHGDVNADGVSDLIVGACANNSSSGVAYIYYGNESGIGGWEDEPNVTITNPGASGDRFGWAVACGDVNNDSISDVIVCAHENDTTDTGVVYVYYGDATPSTHPDVTIDNPRGTGKSSGWFGYSLACGDVNDDTCTDLLIGAPGVEENMTSNRGNAFVYYGPISSGDYGRDNESVKLYNPYNSSDFFGISVACFDINGDGTSDIVIGANATNRTYVRFGDASLPHKINTGGNEMNLTLYDDESNSEFGISVSRAGDVNNDGADDLIVGASANDTAHIFYGGSLLDECADINLTGESGSGFGRSVSASGDVDNDGYAGVIVGTSDDLAGAFYDVNLDVSPFNLSESDAGFGSVVSDIGDVDADGIPDIAVGAPDDGRVYVYTPRFPEEPWLAVGNETDLANGNGTKVWEYTTVIKTDDGNLSGSGITIPAGNSINKTLPIYREITSDTFLSMNVSTTAPTNVTISVNGVEVNASSPAIDTSGNWAWHNITLPGDITEWRIGDNNITINVTSGTLEIGKDKFNKSMIRVILPITQPLKTTETTSDFADAINDWMDTHPLNNVTTYLLTGLPKYQWINLSTNDTGWAVPFLLHSNSSGAINMTNLYIKATPSLDENLDALLPDFVEYNVIFAYLDTLTKGHVYTFSDGSYENILNFTDDVIKNNDGNLTAHILLPENTTEVYIARMDVSGDPVYDTAAAERVNISTEHQHDPCIAVNNSSVMLIWTQDDGTNQQVYSAIRSISAKPWSQAVQVNASSNRQQAGTLGVNNSNMFAAWEGGGGSNCRIYYAENGIGTEVNTSSETQTEPSLAVNSTGHVFLAWTQGSGGTRRIYYSEYNRTAWSLPVPVNSSSHAQTSPSLAVNETGWAFLAWVEDAKIYYSEYNRTAWSPAMQISSAAHQSSPTIAVNDSGWVFAAGVHGTGVNERIYYSEYNRTGWSAPVRVGDEVRQTNPDIAIDSKNHTHIVWEQSDSIYYSVYDGNWSTPIMITDDGQNPTIAVDSDANPHIAWERKNGIWYASGASQTNYGHYPRLPYIVINGTKIWEYNITEINYNDTSTEYQMPLCNGSSLSKTFDIDDTVEGPVNLSIYAGGNNSSFDLYVNDVYVRSGYTNDTVTEQNITTPQNLWRQNRNTVRINVTSGCTDWYYTNSTGNSDDWYYNQTDYKYLPDEDNTWMIRLYGHEYRGTETTDDFSDVLNRCLNPNATTEIEVTIHSDSEGNITLSRLRIYYYICGNETHVTQKRIITHGVPPSDSVTATKLVTIQYTDIPNSTEAINDAEKRIPDASMAPAPIIDLWNLVEVRLEMWYR